MVRNIKNLLFDGKENILTRFIVKKASVYIEPERKGVPKGEPVGLSATKYAAALCNLTSISLKEIAEIVGISYSLLLKWRTEKAFKKTVDQLCREFADLYLEALHDYVAIYSKDESLNLITNDYEIVSGCSDGLISAIYERLKKYGDKDTDIWMVSLDFLMTVHIYMTADTVERKNKIIKLTSRYRLSENVLDLIFLDELAAIIDSIDNKVERKKALNIYTYLRGRLLMGPKQRLLNWDRMK